ncbi:MAG: MFS transporter [Desulfitobacteriaceae bacterium]
MKIQVRTNNSLIFLLSLAHMINDFYTNVLPFMIPYLIIYVGISVVQSTLLVSFFTFSASLIQPFFGYYLDHSKKTSMAYLSILWISFFLGITGFLRNYLLLLLIVTIAGFGSAAFHPQASSMVHQFSGSRKAFKLSVFSAFGNVGSSLAPLFLIPMFERYGLGSSILLIFPGIITAALLFYFTPNTNHLESNLPDLSMVLSSLFASSRQLIAIIGVIATRSLIYVGLITILPLYFRSINVSPITSSRLLFIMLLAGVVGGLLGGYFSDLYGRKKLIVVSSLLATPFFLAFFYTTGVLSAIMLGLAGAFLLASFSVTIVAAQDTIPNNKSLAAGLTMGFASGIGSLGLIPVGWIADAFSLTSALFVLFFLPIFSSGIGLLIHDKNRFDTANEPYTQ